MERNSLPKLISLDRISRNFPYGLRFDYEDPRLGASLEKRGILFPLLAVLEGEKAVLVSGHKRFFCALQKGWEEVPLSFVGQEFSEKELFFLSLYSNWNQSFSDLDRMRAIQKGEKIFRMGEGELQEEVLPALGLSPTASTLEEFRRLARLSEEIQFLVHKGKIPSRGISRFSQFSKEEQHLLSRTLFDGAHFTTNQLILLAEWIWDLKKVKRISLEELFEGEIQNIMKHPSLDPRTRGEKLFTALRLLRFPSLSKEEKDFRRLKVQLEERGEIHIEKPEGLHREGVLLRARLRNRESLTRVLEFLENHRESLESLL